MQLNLTKIDNNNKILLALKAQSVNEVGDKSWEGKAYGSPDNVLNSLDDVKKVIDCYNLYLKISTEVGDRHGEAIAYGSLGNAYQRLNKFKEAIDYYNLCLNIMKEVGDKHGEGLAYGNLGCVYQSLGEFKTAIDYYNLGLQISKEVGDEHEEGRAYGNLGCVYQSLGEFKTAIDYCNRHLTICKEVGDKHGEGKTYGNLGIAYQYLGEFKTAIDYYNLDLKISKQMGDKHGEGITYGNLGAAYQSLGEFKTAIHYYNLHLEISKQVGDKHGEGKAYGNLGIAYQNLGEFKKAIDNCNRHLKISKEVGDKHGEGKAYGNLGCAYQRLGEFKTAIDYYNLDLKRSKEVGDKHGEGRVYGNLGNAYQSLGDFKTAIDFYNLDLKNSKEVGDKHKESKCYGNLGCAYQSLGEFKTAIDYYNRHLKISKEVGDKHGEGNAYGNLGNAYQSLGEFIKAIEYHNRYLIISKEVGDKPGEGYAYGNLANSYLILGDFQKAIEYHTQQLRISTEVGDKPGVAVGYYSLAHVFESLGRLPKAVEHYEASVMVFNDIRRLLKSADEWKVNFRNQFQNAYSGLLRVLVKQGKIIKALFAAEKGRAQALTDLMESSFYDGASRPDVDDEDFAISRYLPSNTIFQAVDSLNDTINFWVLLQGGHVQFRQYKLDLSSLLNGAFQSLESLVRSTHVQVGVRCNVTCENRSLDALRKTADKVDDHTKEESSKPSIQLETCLSTMYNIIIEPIADLVQGDELVIVPDGPLWLAPYPALVDANSKFLCESSRIRLIPSFQSLRLIAYCPDDYHRRSGALLVGDPWVADVTNSQGENILEQLPFAIKEVEMIGKIVNATPLTGPKATKREVLKDLNSVALVHFAAHGCMETGEIALTPDPERASQVPKEKDYILKIGDVMNAKLRAKLVVLSCCHSGQGEIKAEGVVGIARAFMGAGARSVLVSLWAIDDEATLEFMRFFYHHLVEGRSASESLNLAMKSLRESDNYSDIKYWAPFVLIGDDVTLDFIAKE